MFIKHYFYMDRDVFWNREQEIRAVKGKLARGGFGYVTGRRRVGKTALLMRLSAALSGIYHQAVEGTPEQQLVHLAEELKERLSIFKDVTPRTWSEFFQLLSREKLPRLVVFDEFPYWVKGDPTLPSLFQKWIDHTLPKLKTLVLVSGSSQSMLYSQFLRQGAPLYGRADVRIHLQPMSYRWFCKALSLDPRDPSSFLKFSLVGGVPHYWKLMPRGDVGTAAWELYFKPSAILAEEAVPWLRDEGVSGNLPKAMLDFIGRGVSKPSQLASRLRTPQGNLSRPLAFLLDLGLIQKELPFGESVRSTKKVLYRINDPALLFHYGVYLPNRSRWSVLGRKERTALLERHASRVWESFCRACYPGSSRYWEGKVEIDLISLLRGGDILVGECKWSRLSASEEGRLSEDLKARFYATRLAKKVKRGSRVRFRVFSKAKIDIS